MDCHDNSFTGAYSSVGNKVFNEVSSTSNEYGLYIRFKVKVYSTSANTLSLTAAIRFST